MKAIQKELGDGDDDAEIAEYMKKIENTKLSKEAKEKALAEVKKLKSMSSMSAEGNGCPQLSGLDAGHSLEKTLQSE
ncbi:MAG: hypothetical protein ACLU99_08050 [Alphaproteobacteria bacterium]